MRSLASADQQQGLKPPPGVIPLGRIRIGPLPMMFLNIEAGVRFMLSSPRFEYIERRGHHARAYDDEEFRLKRLVRTSNAKKAVAMSHHAPRAS